MKNGMRWMVLAVVFALSGCGWLSAGPKIREGSPVILDYALEADGVAVIPEDKMETMKLVVGESLYPPEFERRLIGLRESETREIRLRPEQAFGPYRQELIRRVPRSQFPPDIVLREGTLIGNKNGQAAMRVAKIFEDWVALDQNHPLAGKKLTYQVHIKEVQ